MHCRRAAWSRVGAWVLMLLWAIPALHPVSAAADANAEASSFSQPNSESLVVGFMGGFVRRDDNHHAEVKMMQSLREEYPRDVYFGMFENRRTGEAYAMIRQRLDKDHDGSLTGEEKRRARIILFGHSWGAYAVVALARRLERDGIPVALTVQVDSVAKPFRSDRLIPGNVKQAVNFYQTRGWVHGRSKIVAADPDRTRILGNFRFDYENEPKEFWEYPRTARWLMKGHIEIESDPQVWLQVKTLLRSQLPAAAARAEEINQP